MMSDNQEQFVGYEYAEVTVKRQRESIYTDNYRNFGWELERSSTPSKGSTFVTLKFKRDRKLRNKAELSRLQYQFDHIMDSVKMLERSKILKAATWAYIIGVLGTAFMAGSVFAVTSGQITLCVVLAIPGLIGWIAPYWVYRSINHRKTDELNPIIDEKYDELYELCDQANNLLQG